MSDINKKYGLIEKKKNKISVADVFNNSDSENESRGKDVLTKKTQVDGGRGLKKQTIIDMNRALEQDSTVYQYDEVYDSMKKKEVEKLKPEQARKAKYMDALIKSADRRKKETERRTERLVQKEREAEGDLYKDKDEYVTSTYKLKLEEMKIAEEEEKKMEIIEAVNDVTKQKDMGSFYRQLYKETLVHPQSNESEEIAEPAKTTKSSTCGSSPSTCSTSSSSSSSVQDEMTNISNKNATIQSVSSKAEGGEAAAAALIQTDDLCTLHPAIAERKHRNGLKDTSHSALAIPTELAGNIKKNGGRRDRSYRQRSLSKENKPNEPIKGRTNRARATENIGGRRTHTRDVGERKNASRSDRDYKSTSREEARARYDGKSRLVDRRVEVGRREQRRRRSEDNRRDKISYSPKRRDEANTAKLHNDPANSAPQKNKTQHTPDSQISLNVKNPSEKDDTLCKIESGSNEIARGQEMNIWEKRTVGSNFDEALQRYYLRQA